MDIPKNEKRTEILFVVKVLGFILLLCLLSPLILRILVGTWDHRGPLFKLYFNMNGFEGLVELHGWDEAPLKPLDVDTQKDLCARFSIAPEDPLCDYENIVYEPDFFPVINDTFKPKDGDWATYDEVQQYLEPYRTSCIIWNPEREGWPEAVTRCRYCLRGNVKSFAVFEIYFDASDESLFKISSQNPRDFR
ncbi:MAG: hypothetical protein HN855_05550 [Anaerolineae bacterium]|jgi:hypothetical protein|nr:hypothetical protein [Anaerolineae bacterium]MBT7072570.1 hypothetical protein [Anaerolineae bacterium]MBT7324604.1 hypothetical protein [Anaerolineae bacterium]